MLSIYSYAIRYYTSFDHSDNLNTIIITNEVFNQSITVDEGLTSTSSDWAVDCPIAPNIAHSTRSL